ncbi:TPA: glycosyltransferase family 1 protein [Vibrio cholerae]|nr:glycosyltransferase family 1 protein [Vibrio cholerae]
MKNVVVIGTVGLPACYGGFESLVENLTKHASQDISYNVFCSSKVYEEKINKHNNAKLIYVPLHANGIQSIFYDVFSLVKALFIKPDVTLILGVSGCIFLPLYSFFSKSKIITNIDGLEWRRDKWGRVAKWFLKFSEKIAVKYSDVVISDNQAISDYVNDEYGVTSRVIAYGGDHVLPSIYPKLEFEDYFLSLCRIEPENNVELILEAFSKMDKSLKFVGNWNNSEFGKKLRVYYSKFSNIEMIDPIYDILELFKLRMACKGYVHGHSAGGTNPSLVEAMHFAKPIYAFDCDFNRYSTEESAIYFSDVNDLIVKLDFLSSTTDETGIGVKMKSIAERRYTWRVIVEEYESLY